MDMNDSWLSLTPEELDATPMETVLAQQLALTGLKWREAEAILLPLMDNEDWEQDMIVWIAHFWEREHRVPTQQETMLHLFEIMDGESTVLQELDRKLAEKQKAAAKF